MEYRKYMAEDERAIVEISRETRRRLNVWKTERELTYDEAINELLDDREPGAARSSDLDRVDPGELVDELEDVDPGGDVGDGVIPGQGQTRERRRAAVESIVGRIAEFGRAGKGELLELVDPDELGYTDRESAWKNCIQPALQASDRVEATGSSGTWVLAE